MTGALRCFTTLNFNRRASLKAAGMKGPQSPRACWLPWGQLAKSDRDSLVVLHIIKSADMLRGVAAADLNRFAMGDETIASLAIPSTTS